MELGSVVEFLENKTILVSGVTGFVAKVFIEKILRVQPNVKKLYLFVRAADIDSAALRFQNEVLAKDVFNVLKEKWGTRLNSFISEKITFVPGDISSEDLGLKDSNLKEELWNELDIMVNSAAITKFDERYDVAFGINTLGVIHLVNFAKKCVKLKVFVHVSTAYVAGERTGLILENPLDGASGLDFDAEMKVIDQKLNELKTKGAPQKEITLFMKNLGTERAKLHGWPNTYVFTKTMGEMLMQQSKENLSLVIIRPTVVSGTYKEPFPGWVEDLKTINTLFVASAQGNLPCLVGETKIIMDVIPVDMVVNAMIVAMVAHAKQPSDANIYHVGSSLRNPVTLGLQVANTVFHNFFKGVYNDLRKKVKFVMRVVEIYKPYFYFNGIFDDTNTEKLRMTARGSRTETDLFYFDPDSIEWRDYFMNTHIPGVEKLLQQKRSFPKTKVFRSGHVPSDKTITDRVMPMTFIQSSRMGNTHFPVSHRDKTYFQRQRLSKMTLNVLRNQIGAAPICCWKPMSGIYAL
ncbi:Fatty acyl-CoA reductase 3 [Citrus sinensis]|uniref:Fatty acyl-CoA reductase 3 n=1 Tax=Citrus sinensis TaxID=2711 RepID=A0ACB8IU42_CITSI|nr:Fatty acyl-CoA reductase 3 [Citrus sinensis]